MFKELLNKQRKFKSMSKLDIYFYPTDTKLIEMFVKVLTRFHMFQQSTHHKQGRPDETTYDTIYPDRCSKTGEVQGI